MYSKLKDRYEWLKAVKGMERTEGVNEYEAKLKRQIRQLQKGKDEFELGCEREYGEESDCRKLFGTFKGTPEEVAEYFIMDIPPSPYDCTGRSFTSRFNVTALKGKRSGYCYYVHLVSLDV